MKLIFLGADSFALPILKTLHADQRADVIAVVTRPAKPAGRGLRPQPNPVMQMSKAMKLPVILISDKKDWGKFAKIITKEKPDLAIIAGLGLIIPEEILDLLPNNFINIHPSLLPHYRGPAPVETAILGGDKEIGVTLMVTAAKMDAGPSLAQYKTVTAHLNAAQLYEKLSRLAARYIIDVANSYLSGKIKPKPQNEQQATYTHIITKVDGLVKLSDDPAEIYSKILAYHPWPGVFFAIGDTQIKIIDAKLKNNVLLIDKLQPAGKKVLSAIEFANGYGKLLTKFPKTVKLNMRQR